MLFVLHLLDMNLTGQREYAKWVKEKRGILLVRSCLCKLYRTLLVCFVLNLHAMFKYLIESFLGAAADWAGLY